MLVSFTRISSNRKTGPIPVSNTEQSSCPETCPLLKSGECYAPNTPLGFIWEAISNGGYHPNLPGRKMCSPLNWDEFCQKIRKLHPGELWRHNAAGDLPGKNTTIDLSKLNLLVEANRKARANGYCYTHKPVGYRGQPLTNARAIYAANKSGFVINLSAVGLKEADELYDLNIAPVVAVIGSFESANKMLTPKGRKVIVCPAETGNIQCIDCRLCSKQRKSIIAFRAHGKRVKNLDNRLRNI